MIAVGAAVGILTGCGLSGRVGEKTQNTGSVAVQTGSNESDTAEASSDPGSESSPEERARKPELTGHETDTVKEPAENTASMRSVAYFTSWSAYARGLEVGDMDPNLLTHVNFAFANVNSDGTIAVGDSWADTEMPFGEDTWEQEGVRGHFGQLQKVKRQYPHLKVLISVGGWTWSGNFSDMAASEEGRKRFADSAVSFLTRYGFDGIDIDWEFPVEGGNGISHRPEDGRNYTLLLQEVRSSLDRQGAKDGVRYLLTVAGGPNVSFTRNTEIAEMMKSIDFMNIMTYDYHGAWDGRTGHNAPLYASDGLSVSDTVEAYLKAGAAPEKLNLGLAFYGRGWAAAEGRSPGQPGSALSGTGYGSGTWEAGVFDYWDLRENYEGKNGYVRYYDEQAKVPYLSNGTTFISYEDTQSVRGKLEYAREKKLGGVMFWEFCGDKNKELQSVISEFFLGGGQTGAQTGGMTEHAPSQDQNPVPPQITSDSQDSNQSQTQPPNQPQHSLPSSAWSKDTVYNKGDTVSYRGHTYRAKWWTQAEVPDEHSKEWEAWELAD